jgi:AcrR family transcriptional regulator
MAKKAPRRTAQRILEVTLDLFNRFGEPNVSTTAISAELGISPGNLYYHYPAKDALINTLFDQYEEALNGLLQASDSVHNVEDAWFFLHTLFEDNPYQFRPIFRGFYFTSAVQEGQSTSRASERVADHRENLARLELMLPGFAAGETGPLAAETLHGRVGFRPMSPDRLPIVGPVPDLAAARPNQRLPAQPKLPGLWCVLGFGARGIVWSALMADLLVSRLEGEPLPLESDLVDACDPGRFLLKAARRNTEESDDRT